MNNINHGTLFDTFNYNNFIKAQANSVQKANKIIASRPCDYGRNNNISNNSSKKAKNRFSRSLGLRRK